MVQILLPIILFIFGLALLLYGADILVKGASSVAKKSGLSSLFIGLTIVAFGTSLPELMVNLFASFGGSNDIALGNVIGSNIVNILLILGISAIIFPLTVGRGTVLKEIPFSILAVLALYVLSNDMIIDGLDASVVSRGDGLLLLMFFIIFMYYVISISKSTDPDESGGIKLYSRWMTLVMVVGGIVGLMVGGNMMTSAAVTIAQFFGLSEALIGLTIVAVGTSLPELASSAMAAYRRQSDIAIGNIVGSNIFNIFWILGLSAFINPLSFSLQLNIDVMILVITSVLLILYMFIGKRHVLQRWQGASFVALYIVYIVYLIYRG